MSGSRQTFVIAEAGVNHNGTLDLALRLVDAAAAAGADAVKFQTFRADKLAAANAPKAAYQKRETGAAQSQLEMLRALELSEADHRAIMQRCAERAIEFMSSPFDEESLALLVRLDVRRVKLGSGELTNGPLLLAAARTRLPLIVSTGMANMQEIEQALGVLAFGMLRASGEQPGRAAFRTAWQDPAGRAAVKEKVTLLQCVTEYPAPARDINLSTMTTMHEAFGVPCGYSDHATGPAISLAAVALGAVAIEKHLTLDRGLPGPDHKASLEPAEFRELVERIRDVEVAIGDGVKRPAPSEVANMEVARKSLVAARVIPRGRRITAEDVAVKRPGNGVSPLCYWEWIGRVAGKDYAEDDPL